MKAPKVLVWENQSIIALDLKRVLFNITTDIKILSRGDDVPSVLDRIKPDVVIIGHDINFDETSKLISYLNNLNINIIVLSTLEKSFFNKLLGSNNIKYKFIKKPFEESELLQCIINY